jgi:DNA-binding CsgD family transcriptional regulator
MKLELFNSAAAQIWEKSASITEVNQLRLELDLYKRILSFFQVGDYYYYVFNIKNRCIDLMSNEVTHVLGYRPEEMNLQFLLEKIHPDDRPWFLNFENKTGEFLMQLPTEKLMKYKRRYDFRLKKNNGDYIRVLQQTMVIEHDENGRLIRSLGVHTDITHLKRDGRPVFSIIGMDGEPSYIDIDVKKVFSVSDEVLTIREKEVLVYLIEGKLSKQIAAILNISKETVDRHRKNMLAKTKLNNTGELIAKAIRQGWI